MKQLFSFISLLLIPLLTVLPVSAEMNDANLDTPVGKNAGLQIRLLDASGTEAAVNSTNNVYTIQVTDSAGLAVADAAVAVRLPDDGASGTFADGSRASVAYTDADGKAKLQPIHWGAAAGTAAVRVTAVKNGLHAGALIEQVIGATVSAAAPAVKPAAQSSTAAVVTPASTESTKPGAKAEVAAASPANASTVSQAKASAPVPGTPKPANAAPVPLARSGAGSDSGKLSTTESAASPSVSVVDTAAGKDSHGSNKKWVLLALVVAGAGAGAAFALSGHSATTAVAAPGLTIGTPSLSVGH